MLNSKVYNFAGGLHDAFYRSAVFCLDESGKKTLLFLDPHFSGLNGHVLF